MVIDSHVLYWFLDGHPRLSPEALGVIQTAADGGPPLILVPVTFWEFAIKERRGQFRARQPVSAWPELLEPVPWFQILPTDARVWLLAAELDWPHRDPADRLIAATALRLGLPVLTKDRVFHEPGCPVKAVW